MIGKDRRKIHMKTFKPKPSHLKTQMLRGVLVMLVALNLTLSLTHLGLGSAFAQEDKGQIIVKLEGYDGVTSFNTSLLDFIGAYIENRTLASSTFSFTNLSLKNLYYVLVNYRGVEYYRDVNLTQPVQEVTLQLYEVTTSDELIVIDFHHVAIQPAQGGINVTEIIQFRNAGNTVYNGTELKIAMPNGFRNFMSQHSCCVKPTDFGYFFGVPQPLKPNETQLIDIRYTLEPDTDSYQFLKRAYYNTDLALLIVDQSLKIDSTQNLQNEGPVDLEDEGKFNAYSYYDMFAGDGFTVAVSGYGRGNINILWIGTGAFILFIVGAVVYGFRATRVAPKNVGAEKEALNSVLDVLEKDFAEGKIKEVEYLKLKLRYKNRLERVEKRLNEYARVGAPKKLEDEREALSSVLETLERDFAEGKVKEVEYLKLKLKYKARLERVEKRLNEAVRVKVK